MKSWIEEASPEEKSCCRKSQRKSVIQMQVLTLTLLLLVFLCRCWAAVVAALSSAGTSWVKSTMAKRKISLAPFSSAMNARAPKFMPE